MSNFGFGTIVSFVKNVRCLNAAGRRRKVVSTAPEQFEPRIVPAAISVVGVDTTPMIVGAYDDVNAHEFSVDVRAPSVMTEVVATPVADSTFDGVIFAKLLEDTDHNGTYETVVGTAYPVMDRLTFTTHEMVDRKVDGEFQVLLQMNEYVPGEFVGVHIQEVSFQNKHGKHIKPSKIGYTNVDGTQFTITDSDVGVSLIPAANNVNAGDQIEYIFGVMNFGTATETDVHQLLFVPEGFVLDSAASSPELYQNPDDSPGIFYWDVTNLQAGSSKTIPVVFTVDASVSGPQEIYASTYVGHRERDERNDYVIVTTNVLPQTVTSSLTLSIDGPPTEAHLPDANDILFANLNYDTTGNGVDVQHMFIAFESRNSSDGSLVLNTEDFIHNVDIRFPSTGTVIHAESPVLYEGLVVYSIPDFVLIGDGTMQIIGDLTGPPEPNLQLRVHVVTASAGSVNIGGLTGLTDAYNIKVADLDTGAVIDVGPGGVINGNFQKVEKPQFFVTQHNIGSMKVAVENEKNVPLFAFESYVGSTAEDVLLTQAVFTSQSGSLLNAYNYAIWVDTDGNHIVDTILQKGVNPQSNQVRFDNMQGGGYVNSRQQTNYYEIHADIASSLTSNTLQLKFETTFDQAIQAETVSTGSPLSGLDVNGSFPSGQMHLSIDTDAVLVELMAKGKMTVEPGSQANQQKLVLAGTQTPTLVTFEVQAQYEPSDITRFQILVTGDDSAIDAVDRFNIYKQGSPTIVGVATRAATGSDPVEVFGTTFTARTLNGQAIVDDGMSQTFEVRAVLNPDTYGAMAGSTFQVSIPPTSLQARGLTSSNILVSGPTSPIIGSFNTITTAMPTNVVNSDPNANRTSVPTGLSILGSFSIDVAANVNYEGGQESVVMHDFVFDVTAINVSINPATYFLINKNDASNPYKATSVTSTPTGVRLVFTNVFEHIDASIPSGGRGTYAVGAEIDSAKVLNSETSIMQLKLRAGDTTWAAHDNDTDEVFIGMRLLDTVFSSTLFTS